MLDVISKKRPGFFLLLILLLGTLLRLFRLGHQSFWYDESNTVNIAARSLINVVSDFKISPPLYYTLLHFWLRLGRSEEMIRLLSVVFGIAALWIIYLLGKRLVNAAYGLLCALLLAVSPVHVWYSQEARMYTLLIFLVLASMLFFVKLLQGQTGKPSVWWALTTGLAIYTHYQALFVLLGQVVFFVLFWPKYRSRWIPFVYSLGLMAVMGLPIFFLIIAGRFPTVSLIRTSNPIQVFSIPYTFFAFSLGFSYGPSVEELHRSLSFIMVRPYLPEILPAALVFLIIFALGLRSFMRERERFAFVLMYLIVPIAGWSLFSLVRPQVSYNVRYVCTALPAYLFIMARGLLAPRKRVVRWVLTAMVVTAIFASIHNHYYEDKYAKSDYRSAAEFVRTHAEDGDIILATPVQAFQYYYRGPLVVHDLVLSSSSGVEMIGERVYGSQRAWLVIAREWTLDPKKRMRNYMRENYSAATETTFANLYLGLFDLPSTQRN